MLTFTDIALADEPPQHIRAVVAVRRFVKCLLGEEVSMAALLGLAVRAQVLRLTRTVCHVLGTTSSSHVEASSPGPARPAPDLALPASTATPQDGAGTRQALHG